MPTIYGACVDPTQTLTFRPYLMRHIARVIPGALSDDVHTRDMLVVMTWPADTASTLIAKIEAADADNDGEGRWPGIDLTPPELALLLLTWDTCAEPDDTVPDEDFMAVSTYMARIIGQEA